MTLAEHCYPLVREWRERFRINQPLIETHRIMWREEDQEFYDSEKPSDVADALGDMIFVWCGCMLDCGQPVYRDEDWFWKHLAHQSSFINGDVKRIVEIVAESNHSKIVKRDEIDATQYMYDQRGVPVEFYQGRDSGEFVCVVSEYAKLGDKEFPKGKIMKSIGFFEPKWSTDDSWIIK